ncbi:hypothetical protein Tco_0606500 [Tanacetum coccineum]
MDDPNITMEEYIRLEEEKAQKRGKVFNWETAKYGKIWYDEDVHDLRSVETEFPAIVFNDNLISNETLYCEPTPKVSCFDDLDFFKDFENEFPAIVYNDALTSKSDFLTEPTLKPQHIDEFDLKDETSLSEYDEVEQNVLYFNDLFPFNIMYPNNLKSGKDNDDNEIDIIQSSRDMTPLPPCDQRHFWLRYQVEGYTEEIVYDFEDRIRTIFGRQVILALGLHTAEEMAKDGFVAYWSGNERVIPDKGDLRLLGWGRHLKRYAEGRKSGVRLSGGHFIGRLAHHFGLVSDDGLRGLSVMTPNTLSNIKLPVLQKDDYDTWAMEMEHYLEYIDNEVWKVIQNGNSKKRVTKGKDGVYRNHLDFHGMDDAKEIWAAIKTRFGGNANSKKMQKAVLKQQFEAFTISSKESLEKGYDRFQKLLSQLDALGASVSDEDANHKFLRPYFLLLGTVLSYRQ